MGIRDILVHPYSIPLPGGFMTAHGRLTLREGAIVEIISETGSIGVGEIAPLPEFGGTTLHTALLALPAIRARLQGLELNEARTLLYAESGMLPRSTVYALEVALLDAIGQTEKCTVGKLFNAQTSAEVHVNAVVGAASVELAVQQARDAVEAGFGCIKLKLGHGSQSEIERVAAVRAAIGPAIHLRLDANEAWNFAQAQTILMGCADFDIQYVEQPLNASDLEGMHALRQSVSIAIAADEAVYDLVSARRVLAAEAADILIVKPQLAGGLYVGQQIIQEAAAQKVQCVLTSSIETGIGLVAALHLAAAAPEVTLECGLATLQLLEDDLLLTDLVLHNGCLYVPTTPGLGVQLDRDALAKYGKC